MLFDRLIPNNSDETPFINEKDIYAYIICVLIGVFIMILCDIFAFKIVNFFGMPMVMSGLLFPLALLISDIISERWGIRHSLIFMCIVTIFGVFTNIILWLISTIPGENSEVWSNAFKLNWIVIFSTFFSISISFSFNAYAINFFKKTIYSISFIGIYVRDTLCNFISKFLLIFIAYNITFFNQISFIQIMELVIATLIFKVIVGLIINTLIPSILNSMKHQIGV
ncbi:VUT family protein [Thiotrichales bacterium 19S3-7]|nr:VUT family protein [Thiotrichales bacterium 19S3-7]MCF6802535.1 VUT family protein [Thiotrichales bacterium 19S3-11]